MQAALPYIDDFLPAHNLHSLQELATHLNRLTARRAPPSPRRRPVSVANGETMSEGNGPSDGGTAARSRRELNPALAPTFRHPLWGHPNVPGGGG